MPVDTTFHEPQGAMRTQRTAVTANGGNRLHVCRTVAEVRSAVAELRVAGESVGLVPTMGALHAGHMALVAAARRARERIVVSIFVNPTQFGDPKDLELYPRTEAQDLDALEKAGVDIVFLPAASEIYPEGDETVVETTRLANMLHGRVRPGHFRGVATVVTKLFNIVRPDAAFFGEKDYQQLHVIRRTVRDLHMEVSVVGVPTVRDSDGLALSSRNVHLSPENRTAALVLCRSLDTAEAIARNGATVEEIDRTIREVIGAEPRAKLVAVDIVAPGTLAPLASLETAPLAIMISAWFGDVLLIDQREALP